MKKLVWRAVRGFGYTFVATKLGALASAYYPPELAASGAAALFLALDKHFGIGGLVKGTPPAR